MASVLASSYKPPVPLNPNQAVPEPRVEGVGTDSSPQKVCQKKLSGHVFQLPQHLKQLSRGHWTLNLRVVNSRPKLGADCF